MKTITLYQVQMPANVVVVVAQIRGLVDFESLNPDFLLKTFFPEEYL